MTLNTRPGLLQNLTGPMLTVYVNTSLANAENRRVVPGYVSWLKQAIKSISSSVLPAEQTIFRNQVRRVEDFLRSRKAEEKSLVILSSAAGWGVIPLQVEVKNEVRWGRPALAQLFSLQNIHKANCVMAIDRTRARFFEYKLGEWADLGELKLELDVGQWKRKDIGHLAHPGIKTTRGTQRDTFEHRVEAQIARLCRESAKNVEKLCRDRRLIAVFLVGQPRLVELIESQLAREIRKRTILIKEDLGKLSTSQLKSRLASVIDDWGSRHESREWVRLGKQAEGKAYGASAGG